jgi:pSer/pThr/pTyr-binding forkhead associated (FHA) protein
VSPFALSVLKYSLLVLLYLFVYRAIRSVVVDVSGRRRAAGGQTRPAAGTSAKASRGGKPPTQIVVHDAGGRKPRTVRLSGQLDIGRGDGCAIRLEDHYVSQVHARLYQRDGAWHVEDLGSTNGTFLNEGTLTGAAVVHVGDTVRVGKTVLELGR